MDTEYYKHNVHHERQTCVKTQILTPPPQYFVEMFSGAGDRACLFEGVGLLGREKSSDMASRVAPCH